MHSTNASGRKSTIVCQDTRCRWMWLSLGVWRTWTSFSLSETRFTISRRACLSGLGLIQYASSRINLSLVLYAIGLLLANCKTPNPRSRVQINWSRSTHTRFASAFPWGASRYCPQTLKTKRDHPCWGGPERWQRYHGGSETS